MIVIWLLGTIESLLIDYNHLLDGLILWWVFFNDD